MDIAVDISLYPLERDFVPPIQDFIDRLGAKMNMMEQVLDVPTQEVITRDNAVILTNAIAFVKVTDPVKAVYGVTNFSEAIRNLIMTTLRSIIGEMELDEALSSRDKIKARLREKLEKNPAQPEHILTKWGVGYYFKY